MRDALLRRTRVAALASTAAADGEAHAWLRGGHAAPANAASRGTSALKASRFGLSYLARHHVLRRDAPLIRGLVLTNRCNLHCRHCDVAARATSDLSLAEANSAAAAFYRAGGRCLYLEGGEPFLWRDGAHTLDDIVAYAHHLGYLTVVVYTNGTLPIRTSADTVFVSIDGLQATHDGLRGRSFERIMGNIAGSSHRSLFVNYTVNSENSGELAAFCEYVRGFPQIRGVFFYLHTPYYGHDALELDVVERRRVLEELLALRRRYRVLNSAAGLRAALRNDWARPMAMCSVYEKGVVHECCRYSGDPELCRQCGYLSYPEIDQVLRLKPAAIANALKYF